MRRWQWLVAVVVVLGIGAAVFFLRPVSGPARDLTLVGDATRGAYLIRIGDCISCHTDPKNKEAVLGGGGGLKTPFGTFYPPNITSDKENGIGNWTLAMFSKAMSDGEGPQGHLYPAFPYDSYTLMSDQEIADLFAALQQQPAISKPSHPHEVPFPFNVRLAMAGWKNLFFHPARYVPDTAHSEKWNRGRYLAFGPAHCVTCHSPRNLLGGYEDGKQLTGNPAGGVGGKTPSLMKDALTKRGYDSTTLAQTLSDGFTPDLDVLGSAMGEVIADGTSHWTDEDRAAVAAYLMGEE